VLAPGVFVEGHEAAGHEGVAAEEDRDGRFDGGLGEIAEEGVADVGPLAKVGEEAIFAGGIDSRVGEQDAGVDEGCVSELREEFEESLDAGSFDVEPEERAGGRGRQARSRPSSTSHGGGGRHASSRPF